MVLYKISNMQESHIFACHPIMVLCVCVDLKEKDEKLLVLKDFISFLHPPPLKKGAYCFASVGRSVVVLSPLLDQYQTRYRVALNE